MKTVGRMELMLAAVAMAVTVWAQAPASGGTKHPTTTAGQGQGHGTGQGMASMHSGGPMAALGKLNLSEDQMQQVHKLMADAQSKQQPEMEQMQKLHEQLRDQVFGDNGPTGNASATLQQIRDVQGRMMQAHLEMAEKLSGILNADQRKQLREMPMGDLMGMMDGHMGGPGAMKHPAAPKK
jgi:Spy/CpxP family protein refolding chaperone